MLFSEQNVGSAAGTRAFGQPLVLSVTQDEEEEVAVTPGSRSPHSPLPGGPAGMPLLSARNAKLNGPALRRNWLILALDRLNQ